MAFSLTSTAEQPPALGNALLVLQAPKKARIASPMVVCEHCIEAQSRADSSVAREQPSSNENCAVGLRLSGSMTDHLKSAPVLFACKCSHMAELELHWRLPENIASGHETDLSVHWLEISCFLTSSRPQSPGGQSAGWAELSSGRPTDDEEPSFLAARFCLHKHLHV